MASPTPNLGMTYPVRGGSVGTWDTPLDTNFDTLDTVIGGTAAVTAAGASATLTQTQANNRRIAISGTITQAYALSFPAIGGEWVVYNGTSGAFAVTLKVTGSSATAITITQGDTIIVNSNGTDLFQALGGGTWVGPTFAGGDLSPASFSTTQNDFNPTGLPGATCLRLNVVGACSLTGIAGGAAGRELELFNIGTATLKCPANSGLSSAANRLANTFNLFPGQTSALRYDATSSLWRPTNVATAYSSCAVAAVSPDLLIVNKSGTENTKIDITTSEAVLVDASGNAIKFESVSVTIDSTTTGPGGCDTGTRAASTSYVEWLVSDGVNINAVASTSSSAATVLTNLTSSGFASYIYFKRIGWNRTDGSSNFYRVRQTGCHASYNITAGSNTAAYRLMGSSDSGGSATVGNYTTLAYNTFAPPTASSIRLVIQNTYNAGTLANVTVAASNANSFISTTTPPWIALQNGIAGLMSTIMPLLSTTNIYWDSDNNGGGISCAGWDDTI